MSLMTPFAYPAGIAPGFDPNHVAAAKVRHSSVAANGGFINCLTGKAGTKSGTPSGSIDGNIGSALSFTSATDAFTFPGNPAIADLNATFGVIYKRTSSSATAHYSLYTASSAGSSGIGFGVVTASSEKLDLLFGGVNSFSSNFVTAVNVPYFIAVSISASAGGGGNANFVIVNLSTGQINISTASLGSFVPSASNGTYVVGNRNLANPALGNVSSAMFSAQYLSMPQLLQWGQDPWSFWYPESFGIYNLSGLAVA